MRKLILAVAAFALLSGVGVAFAAPQSNIFRNILPEANQTYDNGTSTDAWLHVESQQFCFAGGSCITQWPSGLSTSSVQSIISPLIANGTVAGVNATSSTVSFNVQGGGALNPFNVASSSGTSELAVLSNGTTIIGTTTPFATNVNLQAYQATTTSGVAVPTLALYGAAPGHLATGEGVEQDFYTMFSSSTGPNLPLRVGYLSYIPAGAGTGGQIGNTLNFGIGYNFLNGIVRNESALTLTSDASGGITGGINLSQGTNPNVGATPFEVGGAFFNGIAYNLDVNNREAGGAFGSLPGSGISFYATDASHESNLGGIGAQTELWGSGSANADLIFSPESNSATTERMRLTAAGLLGVNSSSPNSILTVEGTPSTSTTTLFTVASSSGISELTVLSNGNVGIGTTNPIEPLTIASVVPSAEGVRSVISATSGGNYGIVAEAKGSGATSNIGLYGYGNGATSNYNLYLEGLLTASTNNWSLYSPSTAQSYFAGNVGIGTSTPDSMLDVDGNVRLEGTSFVTTPSIGGAIIGVGCDSATTSVDSTIASTTAAFITTPQNDPGTSVTAIYSFLSASSVITTRVCGNGITPNPTSYNVKIIK